MSDAAANDDLASPCVEDETFPACETVYSRPIPARAPIPGDDLRVLIVDRDPDARACLERLCRANHLRPLATAQSGAHAVGLARTVSPDLVLVEADLPDMAGLELLEELTSGTMGVLVTARTDLALQAYEAGALDYLVKPVGNRRFAQAVARARMWRARGGDRIPLLIGERQRRQYLLDPARVEYVEAEGNYVIFHAASREYVSRDTLKRLELTLQTCGFLRIENSLLVNVGAIEYAVPFGRGRFVFTLQSGATLRSSLTYRAGILSRLPLARGRR
ncbi:MAG TPA: LytTR family DNA-binding domain-containing protein [Steroidobacteraceae bacterium]